MNTRNNKRKNLKLGVVLVGLLYIVLTAYVSWQWIEPQNFFFDAAKFIICWGLFCKIGEWIYKLVLKPLIENEP